MDQLMSNMKDAGLFYVPETLVRHAVDKFGEDYISGVVSQFKTVRSKMTGGQLTSDKGGKAAEVLYGKYYQQLVRLGLVPQIKKKYRLGA